MMELTAADVQIRRASKSEAMILSNITWRSKGYWGYDEEFLRHCGESLNIKASYIEHATVYVAELNNRISGFYSLSCDNDEHEMTYLQIEPEFIDKGLGKLLWNHAVSQAKLKGWKSFKIKAEPFSEPFFIRMGAIKIDEGQLSFQKKRFIPVLRYNL